MTTTVSRPTIGQSMPTPAVSGGSTTPHQADATAIPIPNSLGGGQTAGNHVTLDTPPANVAGSISDPTIRVAMPVSTPVESEEVAGVNGPVHDSLSVVDAAFTAATDPYHGLAFTADILDDIERVRIANENRLRQLTRSVEDKDGETRGFGLDENHPDVLRLAGMVDMLKKVEVEATKNLEKKMKAHPLGKWIASAKGVGLKQAARLLAATGDPYINSLRQAPRTVSALWAYCGLHVVPADQSTSDARTGSVGGDSMSGSNTQDLNDTQTNIGVAARRRKGQQANWSTNAKMRAYLIAESCVKSLRRPCSVVDGHVEACQCSKYRVVYDKRRAHTKVTRPDWTDGHSHNDALRVASKEVLKDLWIASRDLHKEAEVS